MSTALTQVPKCTYTEPEHASYIYTCIYMYLYLSLCLSLYISIALSQVPKCTYTEPEHASVGLDEASAAAAGVAVDVYENDLAHNDRLILEGDDAEGGFVKILTARGSGAVVGGVVVASRAGEMINEITLAMRPGVGIEALARLVHPYPTAGEGVMQAALGYVRKHWALMDGAGD